MKRVMVYLNRESVMPSSLSVAHDTSIVQQPKRRGRPPKNSEALQTSSSENEGERTSELAENIENSGKRKRGRPRKYPFPVTETIFSQPIPLESDVKPTEVSDQVYENTQTDEDSMKNSLAPVTEEVDSRMDVDNTVETVDPSSSDDSSQPKLDCDACDASITTCEELIFETSDQEYDNVEALSPTAEEDYSSQDIQEDYDLASEPIEDEGAGQEPPYTMSLAPNQFIVTLSYTLVHQLRALAYSEGVSPEDMIIELVTEGITRRSFEDPNKPMPSHLNTRTGYVPPEALNYQQLPQTRFNQQQQPFHQQARNYNNSNFSSQYNSYNRYNNQNQRYNNGGNNRYNNGRYNNQNNRYNNQNQRYNNQRFSNNNYYNNANNNANYVRNPGRDDKDNESCG